jgi:polyisoprenoid-binding protein YceI
MNRSLLLPLCPLPLLFSFGCHPADQGVQFNPEIAKRITEGSEPYRLAGWKQRSVELTASPVTINHENCGLQFMAIMDGNDRRRGTFRQIVGKVSFAEKKLAALSLDLGTDSVAAPDQTWESGMKQLLQSQSHPNLHFESTEVQLDSELSARKSLYRVSGKVTVFGEDKPLSFPLEIEVGDGRFSGYTEFDFDRKSLGMTARASEIGDTVKIKFEIGRSTIVPVDDSLAGLARQEAEAAAILGAPMGGGGGSGTKGKGKGKGKQSDKATSEVNAADVLQSK